jgi:hypothetical protein
MSFVRDIGERVPAFRPPRSAWPGRYELKATASGAAFALGWRSEIRTVIVSDSADRAAEIIIE